MTWSAIADSSSNSGPPTGGDSGSVHHSEVGKSPITRERAAEGRRRTASPVAATVTCSEQTCRPPPMKWQWADTCASMSLPASVGIADQQQGSAGMLEDDRGDFQRHRLRLFP